MQNLKQIHSEVKAELERCTAFWLGNGFDSENGGVYTCLDVKGEVYSTDKSVWMQGRCAWTFSRLCNTYGAKPEWLAFAKSCLDFLEAHCINRDKGGRMYFTVTADGQPLRQRRYWFSEAFYVMGNAEYAAAAGSEEHLQRARDAYELIWKLSQNLMEDPVGMGAKTITQTRPARAMADPMIYLNLSTLMAQHDSANAAIYKQRAGKCADDILTLHHKPGLSATLETVGPNGEFYNEVSGGRVVNPGHSMECAWFILEHALAGQNAEMAKKAEEMFNFAYNIGWDKEFGGLLYFTDVLGKPPESYEHDMKLWWPHNELLIASLMLYKATKKQQYLDIFTETWAYAMRVFSEKEHGEWYGYLRRDGAPTLPAAKGSTFKGPFHLPRMLVMLDTILAEIAHEH